MRGALKYFDVRRNVHQTNQARPDSLQNSIPIKDADSEWRNSTEIHTHTCKRLKRPKSQKKKKKEEEEKKSSLRQKSGRQRCRHVRGRPALPRTWTRRRDKGQHPLSPVIKCHIHSLTAEKETEQLPVMTMIKDAK